MPRCASNPGRRRTKGTPMTQTPNPPAGWYPQDNQERWWDGNGWSDNFRPLGSGQTPQPGQPAMTTGYPTYQQPAYAQPTYGQPYMTQPVKQSHTGAQHPDRLRGAVPALRRRLRRGRRGRRQRGQRRGQRRHAWAARTTRSRSPRGRRSRSTASSTPRAGTIADASISGLVRDRQPQGDQQPRQGGPAAGRDQAAQRQRGRRHGDVRGGDGIDKIAEDTTVTVECSSG